ncbi:toll/interleukin-1 receptor domain-containing protein [Algoriphagus halophilus]|uniref:toll/interleukin-1 receptor domain-containing protein n=1 Tax=Algoriphagus halophilus TaxID=226505 RepID=UPI00358E15EA
MNDLITYDTFLSHSHQDAEVVEQIANKLEDNHDLRVWLDKWILIPGEPFRQAMSKGLEKARTCIIVIGSSTPKGWFEEEVSKALNKQTQDKSFRVIPLLLPNGNSKFVTDFLELRTWVKFLTHIDERRPFHELVCGIKGLPPGRLYTDAQPNNYKSELKDKLKEINALFNESLIDESVKIEFQKMLIKEQIIKRKDER